MSTDIRPEVSSRNPWYIEKERYYELKHYCRQYRSWIFQFVKISGGKYPSKPLEKNGLTEEDYCRGREIQARIHMVEAAAIKADSSIANYILLAVCDGVSYTNLRYTMGMPCGKDYFYDRYRKFFWILSELRK